MKLNVVYTKAKLCLNLASGEEVARQRELFTLFVVHPCRSMYCFYLTNVITHVCLLFTAQPSQLTSSAVLFVYLPDKLGLLD